jgi:hypothetical protein
MPKIELSALKGLKQSAGQGFCDADAQFHTDAVTVGTSLAAVKGALVHVVTAANAKDFTLHTAAAGAVRGQIKIVICGGAGDITVKNHDGNALGSALDAAGDFAICVFNGTDWVAGVSLT